MKILVLVCAHNGQQFVDELVRSIVEQTRKPDQICFFDWASDDNTLEIAKAALKNSGISCAFYRSEQAPGASASFLLSLKKVSTSYDYDYVALADQDDIWEVDKLEVLEEFANTLNILASDVSLIDSNGNSIDESHYGGSSFFRDSFEIDKSIIFSNPVIGMTMMIPRKVVQTGLELIDAHNINLVIMHDWFFLLTNYFLNKDGFQFIPRKLVRYRQHDNNLVGVSKKVLLDSSRIKKIVTHFDLCFAQYNLFFNGNNSSPFSFEYFKIIYRSRILNLRGKTIFLFSLSLYLLGRSRRV